MLAEIICLLVGHRWYREMSSHPMATSGWLRCSRCKNRF